MNIKYSKESAPLIINDSIRLINPSKKNSRGAIVINEKKMELVLLPSPIVIPALHVSHLLYEELIDVADRLCAVFPEYLTGHTLLENQKPPSETHSFQFARYLSGQQINFVHLLSFDLNFGSGVSQIRGRSNKDYYPEYTAEGIVVSSKLIPVESVDIKNGVITDFHSVRILKGEKIDAGERRTIHAIFDDFDPTEMNEKIFAAAESELFPFSHNVYQFIHYDFFTACINIPDPLPHILEKAVKAIEPVTAAVFARFAIRSAESVISSYGSDLAADNGLVNLLPDCVDRTKKFFARYSIYIDDELMLKRWRRLDVND